MDVRTTRGGNTARTAGGGTTRGPWARRAGWTFAIDRGGTFTDVVGVSPQGVEHILKLPSTSPRYEDAGVEAMRRLLGASAGAPFPAEIVASIKIGTTVATNALLERAGARTLLVTTRGFADALAIGDQTRPDLFALEVRRAPPLYAGVLEVDERLGADGGVVKSLDEEALKRSLGEVGAAGFDSAAVAFLHSDINPAHEQRAADILREAGLTHVTLSSEASPLPKFVPRAETAVADAYLTPVLGGYVRGLTGQVSGAPVFFMTSAGALAKAEGFRGRDAVVSGPAGGVIGVAAVAARSNATAVLGFDMGGTSTDVCRFAGELERRDQTTIAGAKLRAPRLDVETVAAGGGSILAFDGLRARVGPQSAGAAPGPAAYGLGGPPTITDANLVLGRLDPKRFPQVFGRDGNSPLNVEAAHNALAELALRMGAATVEAAAEGFLAVAVEQAAAAIRRISTERGFDPRDHSLVAFGGAAGQLACAVADALDVREILCPRRASVLSAWGIGQARIRVLYQEGLERKLDKAGLAAACALARRLRRKATAALTRQSAKPGKVDLRVSLRYAESDAAIVAPLSSLTELRNGFEASHRRLFGFIETGQSVVISSVEAEVGDATGPRPAPSVSPDSAQSAPVASGSCVRAEDIGAPIGGPRLILREDTQIWLADGWRAEPDDDGLLRLTRIAATKPGELQPAPDTADPVTLELFNRRFMGVAESMGAALERTARSVNIKERLDFSCALFDAAGGLVANAPHMPVHLGSMDASVRAVRARHRRFAPGQAFALNNPYAGGTHLPDITVVMPVFVSGEKTPDFFTAARGHHADVGGVQPGSMPPFSTSITEEGVMFDAVPIMADGRFLEADVRASLASGPWPARSPDRNVGDLKAQIAACRAGAETIERMIAAHGGATVARYMRHVQANAEACVRRAVGRLRPGSARIPIDGGGEIALELSVDAARGEAELDFTGSSAQLNSNFNAPAAIVHAAALYVFRTLVDDDIPLNAGCLTPLAVKVRPGSMLDPRSPAAVVAGNVETSQHIVDALYRALGVMAASQGTMNNFTFGDDQRQYYETLCGGVGATARAPGASAVHSHMTNSRLTDPEILERRFPVRVEAFEIRLGSGGEGRQRGGDGVRRRIRFLQAMDAALLSTRRDHSPPGLAGGGDGRPGAQRLIRVDGTVMALAGCFALKVRAGEAIEIETPGGGGFGKRPSRVVL